MSHGDRLTLAIGCRSGTWIGFGTWVSNAPNVNAHAGTDRHGALLMVDSDVQTRRSENNTPQPIH